MSALSNGDQGLVAVIHKASILKNDKMKIKALQIEQSGKKMYVGYLSAKTLSKLKTKVDVYDDETKKGYQRDPTLSKVREAARFLLSKKGVFPMSALLSIRGEVSFRKEKENFGILTVKDDEIFWQVDGQHRIAGLLEALKIKPELENFEMPVIIISPKEWAKEVGSGIDPSYLEAYQFYVINKTQTKIRPDLAEQFLSTLLKKEKYTEIISLPSSLIRGNEWISKAIDIQEMLNKEGVWKNRIRQPNADKDETVISRKSFTDSLKPILTNNNFKQYSSKEISDGLNRFWEALKELMPSVFQYPKDYVIQKITGPFVLHEIFPDISSYCPQGDLSKDNIKEVLKGLKEGVTEEFWSNNGTAGNMGTNKKAFSILVKMLRENLTESNTKQKPIRPFKI